MIFHHLRRATLDLELQMGRDNLMGAEAGYDRSYRAVRPAKLIGLCQTMKELGTLGAPSQVSPPAESRINTLHPTSPAGYRMIAYQ